MSDTYTPYSYNPRNVFRSLTDPTGLPKKRYKMSDDPFEPAQYEPGETASIDPLADYSTSRDARPGADPYEESDMAYSVGQRASEASPGMKDMSGTWSDYKPPSSSSGPGSGAGSISSPGSPRPSQGSSSSSPSSHAPTYNLPRLSREDTPATAAYDDFLRRSAESKPGDPESFESKPPSTFRRILAAAYGGAAGYYHGTPGQQDPNTVAGATNTILHGGGEGERLTNLSRRKAGLAERAKVETGQVDDRVRMAGQQAQLEHWKLAGEAQREVAETNRQARDYATDERRDRRVGESVAASNALAAKMASGDIVHAENIPRLKVGGDRSSLENPPQLPTGGAPGSVGTQPSVPSLPSGWFPGSEASGTMREPGWNEFQLQMRQPDGTYNPVDLASPTPEHRVDLAAEKTMVDVPPNMIDMFGGSTKVPKSVYDSTLRYNGTLARDKTARELGDARNKLAQVRNGIMANGQQIRLQIHQASQTGQLNPRVIQQSIMGVERLQQSVNVLEANAQQHFAEANRKLSADQYKMSTEDYKANQQVIVEAHNSELSRVNEQRGHLNQLSQELLQQQQQLSRPQPQQPQPAPGTGAGAGAGAGSAQGAGPGAGPQAPPPVADRLRGLQLNRRNLAPPPVAPPAAQPRRF